MLFWSWTRVREGNPPFWAVPAVGPCWPSGHSVEPPGPQGNGGSNGKGAAPRVAEAGGLGAFVECLYGDLDLDSIFENYLAKVDDLLSADARAIYLLEPDSRKPVRVAARGAYDSFLSAYELRGRRCDPLFDGLCKHAQPAHNSDIAVTRAWKEHPFRSVLSLQGLDRVLEAPIVTEEGLLGSLNFARPSSKQLFSDEDLELARRISRHVSTAVGYSLRLRKMNERTEWLEATLENFETAVMLTDLEGNVHFTNREGRRLLECCQDDGRLDECVRRAMAENLAGLGMGEKASQLLKLPARSYERHAYLALHTVHIPCRFGLAATFVYRPGETPNLSHLENVLTPQEIRVLELVAQGLANKRVAEHLTISVDTVKSHLKRIFTKLHVASRSQLLSAVFFGSLSGPE